MSDQGDVLLQQTADGGEITVDGGVVELTGSFQTAAYLSLFGGNLEDDGSEGSRLTWWGNLGETNPARRQVSRLQHLTRAIPLLPIHLPRIQDAALADLQWFLDESIASTVNVTASIPAINRLRLVVEIFAEGRQERFEFVENWLASPAPTAPPAPDENIATIITPEIPMPVRGALLVANANTTLPHNTATGIDLATTEYDTDGLVAGNTIVVPAGVDEIRLRGQVRFSFNGNGQREVSITKNGSQIYPGAGQTSARSSPANHATFSAETPVLRVSEGDVFALQAFHTAGSNINAEGTIGHTWLFAEIID